MMNNSTKFLYQSNEHAPALVPQLQIIGHKRPQLTFDLCQIKSKGSHQHVAELNLFSVMLFRMHFVFSCPVQPVEAQI